MFIDHYIYKLTHYLHKFTHVIFVLPSCKYTYCNLHLSHEDLISFLWIFLLNSYVNKELLNYFINVCCNNLSDNFL